MEETQSQREQYGPVEEPEHADLLRLTKLVEHLFHVPAAYLALLGPGLTVTTLIGSASCYWDYLKTWPLAAALARPHVWHDTAGIAAPGFTAGDLRFVAAAPLRSSDGLELGLLVIADTAPRPNFSEADRETLGELAMVLAGKMEMRMIASQALESEATLHEAESRFRNMANSAPVMIIYTGPDGGCSFVNREWLEFSGRTLEDEIGDGFAEMIHPHDRKAALQRFWNALQQRLPLTQEIRMRRRDGEYRWMRSRGQPRFLDDGRCAGFVGCFVDITDQRSVALDLHKERLCTAAVAEAAGVFYLILDPEGRIERVGDACHRAFGYEAGQLAGLFIWEACKSAIPAAAAVRDAIRQAVGSRTSVKVQTSRPSSEPWETSGVLWTFTPILFEHGEVLAVTATAVGLNGDSGSPLDCDCGHHALSPTAISWPAGNRNHPTLAAATSAAAASTNADA